MAKPSGADSRASIRVWSDVEDDVVRVCTVPGKETRRPWHRRQVIETQKMPYAPGDIVVGAGGIAAHAKPSHNDRSLGIQGESASEDIDSADTSADHGIVGRTVVRRI